MKRWVFVFKQFQSYLVHPCDEANNGGCSQICNKKNEKHECSCEVGFALEEDKKTCQKGKLTYTCLNSIMYVSINQ